ncbi:hypothetical protein [Flavobacterium ardleyense]|uniref:hypothetical protein n=1 Tax=Flavobacterium ardleyense TaxID=2038737 RepID=UPI00298D3F2D|nr:hypothetical protein [Flavobacterium ardleyense]
MNYPNSEVLKQFSKLMNGNFIERSYWESDKVKILHRNHPIIFDNYTEFRTSGGQNFEQKYTRVLSSFSSNSDFRFEIYPQSLLDSISKIFGAQDVKIGDKEFDRKFIIKSNDELKVKSFLKNDPVKLQILAFKDINFQISDQKGIWGEKLPDGEFELSFFINGLVDHTEILKQIHKLFCAALNRLEEMDILKTAS